jgi:hypothetical protein
MKTPKNTEEDSDDPEPANDGDILMEYCYDCMYSPGIETVTKKLPVKTGVLIGTV